MKNRVPTRPNRRRIVPEAGSGLNPFWAVIERADEPVEPGTPLNKHTLLQDEVAEMYRLVGTNINANNYPTVNNALRRARLDLLDTIDLILGESSAHVTLHLIDPLTNTVVPAGTQIIIEDGGVPIFTHTTDGVRREISVVLPAPRTGNQMLLQLPIATLPFGYDNTPLPIITAPGGGIGAIQITNVFRLATRTFYLASTTITRIADCVRQGVVVVDLCLGAGGNSGGTRSAAGQTMDGQGGHGGQVRNVTGLNFRSGANLPNSIQITIGAGGARRAGGAIGQNAGGATTVTVAGNAGQILTETATGNRGGGGSPQDHYSAATPGAAGVRPFNDATMPLISAGGGGGGGTAGAGGNGGGGGGAPNGAAGANPFEGVANAGTTGEGGGTTARCSGGGGATRAQTSFGGRGGDGVVFVRVRAA